MKYFLLFSIGIFLTSCSSSKHFTIDAKTVEISKNISPDSSIIKLYKPYKDSMDSMLNFVIGYTKVDLVKGDPESPLGNFFTDALLYYVLTNYKDSLYGFPTMVLLNGGGFRTELRTGPITIGDVFRLMPFDNTITILQLKGIDLLKLFNFIAQKGGMPIAGARLLLDAKTCVEANIHNSPVQENNIYNVVTSNYLANGGDNVTIFTDAVKRIDLSVRIRDAFIEYIKVLHQNGIAIEAKKDGRIKYKGFDE